MIYSKDEAIERVKNLQSKGFDIFPNENIQIGARGYFCSRIVNKETREEITESVQWYIFGKALNPIVKNVSASELVDVIAQNPKMPYSCDLPQQLKLGLVWYEPESNSSKIYYTRVIQLKTNKQDGEILLQLKEELRQNSENQLIKTLLKQNTDKEFAKFVCEQI